MNCSMEKVIAEGLTFDDVLVLPAYSQILPSQVKTRTQLGANVAMEMPILAAAMAAPIMTALMPGTNPAPTMIATRLPLLMSNLPRLLYKSRHGVTERHAGFVYFSTVGRRTIARCVR